VSARPFICSSKCMVKCLSWKGDCYTAGTRRPAFKQWKFRHILENFPSQDPNLSHYNPLHFALFSLWIILMLPPVVRLINCPWIRNFQKVLYVGVLSGLCRGVQRSAFFWIFTHRRLVTDVSGNPIGLIFKGKAVLCQLDPRKIGPINYPVT